MALVHGGQLSKIAKQFNRPENQWLDLSTGIAPVAYPIPEIKLHYWQDLPTTKPGLIQAAKNYYRANNIVVTNGSQALIKALPSLYLDNKNLDKSSEITVYIPQVGYKEHEQAWRNTSKNLTHLSHICVKIEYYSTELPAIESLTKNCILVVINPNNPSGTYFNKETLCQYQNRISKLDGLLVIDEAFADVFPHEQSMCSETGKGNLLVLRSFGKFFGLAGIRIGFACCCQTWKARIEEALGPWQVNGPAQAVAENALLDHDWQAQQRQRLSLLREQLEQVLKTAFPDNIVKHITGCDLFLTVYFSKQGIAEKLYHQLCLQAIYCRLTDEKDSLRFGITTKANVKKLEQACSFALKQL